MIFTLIIILNPYNAFGQRQWAGASDSAGVVWRLGNVGIGTTTVPHGGVGMAKLAIEGVDRNSAGPHLQFTTTADDYPTMQIFNWKHDLQAIYFDSYNYDTHERSSYSGSNYRIVKTNNRMYSS